MRGDYPGAVRGGGDEKPVHGPVMVFAEGDAVGGVIVEAAGERDEVGGIDESEIIASRKADAEAAGGALAVVDFEDFPAEGGVAAGEGQRWIFLKEVGAWRSVGGWERWMEPRPDSRLGKERQEQGTGMGEISGNEGVAQEHSVHRGAGELLHAAREGSVDGAVFGIGCGGSLSQGVGPGSRNPDRLPPALALQMTEGEFRMALILKGSYEIKINLEPVPQGLVPGDAVRSRLAGGQKVQHREDQTGLVGLLVPKRSLAHHIHIEAIQGFHHLVGGGKERSFTTSHAMEVGSGLSFLASGDLDSRSGCRVGPAEHHHSDRFLSGSGRIAKPGAVLRLDHGDQGSRGLG